MNAARLALAAGALWIARAGVGVADPLYYDPSTVLDYSAVVLTTLATVVTGLAILAARPRLGRVGRILAFIPAFGFIVMGVANLFEDAFGVAALGALWGVGGLSMMVGLVLTTVASLAEPDDRKLGFGLLVFFVASLLPEEAREWAQGAAILLLAHLLSSQNADVPSLAD